MVLLTFNPDEYNHRRETVAKHLRFEEQGEQLVYLAGHVLHERPYTDVELPFRQESNFWYLAGIHDIAGCHFLYAVKSKKSYLFLPVVTEDEAVWMGPQVAGETLMKPYHLDHVLTADLLESTIISIQPTLVFHLKDVTLGFLSKLKCKTDGDQLACALAETRIVKSPMELEFMRKANRISSEAHQELMRYVKQHISQRKQLPPSEIDRIGEREVTSHWYALTHKQNCAFQAYLPIVAYGPHAATLHYNRNDGLIPASGSSFLLVDAGAEYGGYASDITRTYPIRGRFETVQQKLLYESVLKVQMAVLDGIRPGVAWEDLHRLAVEILGQSLIDMGILKLNGSTLNDLCWKKFIVQRFLPHGLGHLIGMDVHDVGGYPTGVERIQEPGIRYLRMRRKLQKGYVVTVEPGCYFIDVLLEAIRKDPSQAPHVDFKVVEEYKPLGGVRIEDCVVVTDSGYENLTSAPKTIEEIEKVMA